MTSNLIGLRVESFKRIGLVELEFPAGGGTFGVMGANEAGKSTLFDALDQAIAGRKAQKFQAPVRKGAEVARIIATFDDIVVTRTIKVTGQTSIKITNREGVPFAKTEEILSKFYSHVSFDPFAFSKLSERDQIVQLLALVGLDTTKLDAAYDLAYSQRTTAKQALTAATARVDATSPTPPWVPAEPVSVSDLSAQLQAALASEAERATLAAEVTTRSSREVTLEQAVAELTAQLAATTEAHAAARDSRVQAEDALAGFTVTDPDPIRAQLDKAEETNALVRGRVQRDALVAEHAAAEAEWKRLDAAVDEAQGNKKKALAEAAERMPVPGLAIDADTGVLMFGDDPFSQASTAVKVRTGTQLAIALDPTLKLAVIRDASLLDDTNRAAVDALAKEHGFLVLMELADERAQTGVILEEGFVREIRSA